MKKYVEVRVDVEGLHHWPDCNLPHVDYLAHVHRHTFQILARAEVKHGDRDIEFIDFKHKNLDWTKCLCRRMVNFLV